MTELEELEALDDLISAVKAGETCRVHIERMSAQAGLAEAGSIYGAAYQDDLNAARMVHNALVPHWALERMSLWPTGLATFHLWGTHEERGERWHSGCDGRVEATDGKPGRAWLLASLQAYRSTLVAS